jgi:hypothetical protein
MGSSRDSGSQRGREGEEGQNGHPDLLEWIAIRLRRHFSFSPREKVAGEPAG